MFFIISSTMFGLILFFTGYYFGHKMGGTRYLRGQLAKIKASDR